MMNLEKIYKNIVLVHVLLFIFAIIYEFFFINDETVNLSIQLGSQEIYDNTYFLIFGIITLILYLINLFFLYKFYSFSKNLFVILLLLFYFQYFFLGLLVYEPLEFFLNDLITLTQGALLTLIFLTPLKEKFKNS